MNEKRGQADGTPATMEITVDRVAAATDEVQGLLLELDRSLADPYAAHQQHGLAIDELFQPGVCFFLARLDGLAVGCAGIAFCDGYAELKRMYCRPSARGRGIAQTWSIARCSPSPRCENRSWNCWCDWDP